MAERGEVGGRKDGRVQAVQRAIKMALQALQVRVDLS